MHELSVALSILDVAAEGAAREGAAAVAAIHLRLGPLAGVVKEALLSAFELAREGSPLAAARLVIEEVPVVVYCPRCAAERRPVSSRRPLLPRLRQPDARGHPGPGATGRCPGGRDVSAPTRLVQVRQHALKHNDVAAPRLAGTLPRGRGVRGQPRLQPRRGQDRLPGKSADAAGRAAAASPPSSATWPRTTTPAAWPAAARRFGRLPPGRSAISTPRWSRTPCTAGISTGLDLLFIENVGNLVCPSSFDLGEDLRLVLFSVTEGEDKPLKYPTIFNTADVAVLTKVDLAEAVEFDAGRPPTATSRPCGPACPSSRFRPKPARAWTRG